MANTTIALRQSGATGNTPSLGIIANGEISLNYADGILYYKTASNTLGSIRTTQPAGLTTEVQFNDAGSFGSDSNFTYNKTTDVLTVVGGVIAGGINVASAISSNAAYTTSAFALANTANITAEAAFAKANTDATNVSVTAGSYGNVTSIPTITIAANGRVVAVTSNTITAATIGDALALSIALG